MALHDDPYRDSATTGVRSRHASESRFFGDLGWSLRAWGRHLWFPMLVVVVLGVGVVVDDATPVLVIPYGLVLAGFSGTQWRFYLDDTHERALRPRDIARLTLTQIPRFTRLALIVFGPLVVLVLGVLAAHASVRGAASEHAPGWLVVTVALYSLLVDILLTFVSPTLASSTGSALGSLRAGVGLLRGTWPSSGWYVLAPGLTVGAISVAIPRAASGEGSVVSIAVVAGVLGFLFKGAIAAYYARLAPPPSSMDDQRVDGRADAAVATQPTDSAELDFDAGRWLPDPLDRHDERWWNGVTWDPAVRDGQVVSHDPLP